MPDGFPLWLWSILEQAPSSDPARNEKGDSGEEEGMSEQQYINYYRCPVDGTEWVDVWSCCCNDMCPKCETKDIEPYKSEDVVHTKIKQPAKLRRQTPRKRPSK